MIPPTQQAKKISRCTARSRTWGSRVSRKCPTWYQNSIFFLELDPIPFLGLDLIDPRSSYLLLTSQYAPSASFLWCNNLSQICYMLHWPSSCFLLIIYQSISNIGCRIQTNNTHILTLCCYALLGPGERNGAHRSPSQLPYQLPSDNLTRLKTRL